MEKQGAFIWKIEKIVSKGDYSYCIVRDHPNRTKNDYVLLHRVIVENHLGRLLNTNEIVHHKNENKKDNRIENLELMSASKHSSLHGANVGSKMMELICPECKVYFLRERRQTHIGKKKGKYTCCSSKCRGKFSRRIQLYGETDEVESAISGNLLREFNSLDNPKETVLQQAP